MQGRRTSPRAWGAWFFCSLGAVLAFRVTAGEGRIPTDKIAADTAFLSRLVAAGCPSSVVAQVRSVSLRPLNTLPRPALLCGIRKDLGARLMTEGWAYDSCFFYTWQSTNAVRLSLRNDAVHSSIEACFTNYERRMATTVPQGRQRPTPGVFPHAGTHMLIWTTFNRDADSATLEGYDRMVLVQRASPLYAEERDQEFPFWDCRNLVALEMLWDELSAASRGAACAEKCTRIPYYIETLGWRAGLQLPREISDVPYAELDLPFDDMRDETRGIIFDVWKTIDRKATTNSMLPVREVPVPAKAEAKKEGGR